MTISYDWAISALDTAPSLDGLTDVIQVAHWRLRATDDTDDVSAETYGAQGFEEPDPAAFTPFDTVTQAEVVAWIEDAMGEERMTAVHASLAAQIETTRNPPIVTKSPPWVA